MRIALNYSSKGVVIPCVLGGLLSFSLSLSQDQEARCKVRYDQVRADGEKIHALVRENMQHFQVSIHCGTALKLL